MEAELSQFARELYERRGVRHQGQISQAILIPEGPYAEYPDALLYEVCHFADALYLLPGEYSVAAHVSRCVEGYVSAVHNGGHRVVIERGALDPLFVKFCEAGLEWTGCKEHAAIFADFVELVRSDVGLAKRVWRRDETAEWNELRALDDAMFSLSLNDQISQQADWLRSTGQLRILAPNDLKQAKRDLEKQNTLKNSRERMFSRSRGSAHSGHAIVQVADRFGAIIGKELGRKWIASAKLLSDIEFGSDPIPVRFWENDWSLSDRNAPDFAVYRIVVVPPCGDCEPAAVLYEQWNEAARIPLNEGLFLRACTA